MSRVRRLAATFASAAALAGCALLSGAGDLTVGDAPGSFGGTDAASVSLDGATGSDVSTVDVDGSREATDGALGDAKSDGEGGTRLRNVTFEDGALVGVHGGDSVFGVLSLVTGPLALAGNDSMLIGPSGLSGVSGIQVNFAPVDELYATALVRFETLNGPTHALAFLPPPGGVTVALEVDDIGPLALYVGGLRVGKGGSITDGTVHRLGFHLRNDAMTSLVEVFLAPVGATAFGTPIIKATTMKLGRTTNVRMGDLDGMGGGGAKLTFDDLLLDTLAMPP
jgi:hypothetical protein